MTYKELFRETCPFSQELYEQIVYYQCRGYKGKYDGERLFYAIALEKDANNYSKSELTTFCENANSFITHYPAPVSYKQLLREKFVEWAKNVGTTMKLETEEIETALVEIGDPVKRSITEEIIKALHDRDGVTKDELVTRLGVSSRTINNELSKLGGATDDSARLYGQQIRVEIDSWSEYNETNHPTIKHYVTKNTLHPIALQMNVSQVGTMLTSLAHSYYNEESSIAHGLGVDIWCQLTDYAKERIQLIFASKDADLKEFIDELEDECTMGRLARFQTEMENFDDLNQDEQIMTVFKNSRVCDISCYEDGEWVKYHNCKVGYDSEAQTFYFTEGDQNGDRFYFHHRHVKFENEH